MKRYCLLFLALLSLPSVAEQPPKALYRRWDLDVNTHGCKSVEAWGPVRRLWIENGYYHIYVNQEELHDKRMVFVCLW